MEHEQGSTVSDPTTSDTPASDAVPHDAAAHESALEGGSIGGAVVGAAVGGVIGAAVWAGISHFLSIELGWIAVGVGFLSGLGAATAAKSKAGPATGVVAALIAIASIFAGKYASAALELSAYSASFESPQFPESGAWQDDDQTQFHMAFSLVLDREATGAAPANVGGFDVWETESLDDFPADVVAQVESSWASIDEDEREAAGERAASYQYRSSTADEIAFGREAAGETLNWPAGMTYDEAYRFEHYPQDTRDAVNAQWATMDRAEQARTLNTYNQAMADRANASCRARGT
ncbi:MAG: hypothetical protein AAF108_00120 [Planctomycetota bacterium]